MARPVAMIRRSPFAVSGMSVEPVCRPLSDHSVSPWRIINTLGVPIMRHYVQEEGHRLP